MAIFCIVYKIVPNIPMFFCVFNYFQLFLDKFCKAKAVNSIIISIVKKLRKKHPEVERFMHNFRDEPFFVKNLENVFIQSLRRGASGSAAMKLLSNATLNMFLVLAYVSKDHLKFCP